MSRLLRKGLLCLLMLCVLTASVLTAAERSGTVLHASADRTVADVDKDIKDCEALIANLKSELNARREELEDLNRESASTLELAEVKAQEILLLETEIELNQSLMESCDIKLNTARAERILVENEYTYFQNIFGELMRFVYENGSMTDFELLFSSADLNDYLNRRDDFNSILECINDLTESIASSKAHLEELETEYEIAVEKYDLYVKKLEEDRDTLQAAKEELERYASELGVSADDLTGKVSELSSALKEAQSKLAKLKEERQILYEKQQTEKDRGDYIAPTKISPQGFAWPLEMGISYRISSYFSTRTNPITGRGTEFHQGLDIACNGGTRILASRSGVVTKAEWYGGYGNCVIVYHGKDSKGRSITTLYGHARKLVCSNGDQVRQGDVLSLVGTTGRSTGNHLHFSVLVDGVYVDPDDYLPDGYYKKLPNT